MNYVTLILGWLVSSLVIWLFCQSVNYVVSQLASQLFIYSGGHSVAGVVFEFLRAMNVTRWGP